MNDNGIEDKAWMGALRPSLIRGRGDWRSTQATLPDRPQTLAFSLCQPPLLLTVIVPLAEQLQESEQVLGEFIICHDLLSWVEEGGRGQRDQMRQDTARMHVAHAHCTRMQKAWGAQGGAATPLKTA